MSVAICCCLCALSWRWVASALRVMKLGLSRCSQGAVFYLSHLRPVFEHRYIVIELVSSFDLWFNCRVIHLASVFLGEFEISPIKVIWPCWPICEVVCLKKSLLACHERWRTGVQGSQRNLAAEILGERQLHSLSTGLNYLVQEGYRLMGWIIPIRCRGCTVYAGSRFAPTVLFGVWLYRCG